MIFKLDVNQGICICREEEGEIIIPTETGFFNVGDYVKICVVNRVEKWGKNVQDERAFHFAPFLTAVNQGGRTEKAEKVDIFYFVENRENPENLEKFLVLTFSR